MGQSFREPQPEQSSAIRKRLAWMCDVSHVLATTISTASHHLRKLRDLKVLKTRNDGKWTYYSLRSGLAGDVVADLIKSVRGFRG